MYRVLTFAFVIFLCGLTACSQQSAPTQTTPPPPEAAAAPSTAPATSPSAMAIAPTLATPVPGSSVAPMVPNPTTPKDNGKQAKADQKPLPPDLWQRMTRPLTLEEINKLPPETRDMILRAQGRLPASPTPKKK